MSLRLIVMRHAKSSWKSGASNDHDRPLNKRGQKDAPRVARHLKRLGWVPERVVSSDSARTRETWALMADVFDDDIDTEFTRRLYHGGLDELADKVAEQRGIDTLLVLGHNPGFEHAVAWLTGEQERMTTANAALLELDSDKWAGAFEVPGRWQMIDLLRPKEI